MSTSASSFRRRSIQSFGPKVPPEEQQKEIADLAQNLFSVLVYNEGEDLAVDAKGYFEEIRNRNASLFQDLWGLLRTSVRQKNVDLIQARVEDFVKQMKSYGDLLCRSVSLISDYLDASFKNCAKIPFKRYSLQTLIDESERYIADYYALIEKYNELAKQIHAKAFLEQTQILCFRFCLKCMKALDQCQKTFFDAASQSFKDDPTIKILKRSKNGELVDSEKYKGDRENMVQTIMDYFHGQKSMFLLVFSHAMDSYPTQFPLDENDDANQARIEKFHQIRETYFGKLLEMIKTKKNTLLAFLEAIGGCTSTQDTEQTENEDNEYSLELMLQSQTASGFFDIIFHEFNDLMKSCHTAKESDHVSQVGANILELFSDISKSKLPISYLYYSMFYNDAIKMGDVESANQIEQDLTNSIDVSFEELGHLYQDESMCTVFAPLPTDDAEIQEMKKRAAGIKEQINKSLTDLLPTLVQTSQSYYTSHPAGQEPELENQDPDEPEPIDNFNPFSDFLSYFSELAHNHLIDLFSDTDAVDEAETDETSKQSQKSRQRLTMNELTEKRNSEAKMKKARACVVQEAIVATISSLMQVIRAKIVESVRDRNFESALQQSKELTSLAAKNGKELLEMRKRATIEMDVEKVQEIDKIALQLQIDSRSELLKCFDEALQEMIELTISNYHIYVSDYNDARELALQTLNEELNSQFSYIENQLHIPQLVLLEKKLRIELEREKMRTNPEIEELRQKVIRLARTGDFQTAKLKKEEFEKKEQIIQEEMLRELTKKQNEKRKELLVKHAESLKRIEEEYERQKEIIRRECAESQLNLRKMLSTSIISTQTMMVNKAILLMTGTSKDAEVENIKSPKKDEYSRKEIHKRFQKVTSVVLKEYDLQNF